MAQNVKNRMSRKFPDGEQTTVQNNYEYGLGKQALDKYRQSKGVSVNPYQICTYSLKTLGVKAVRASRPEDGLGVGRNYSDNIQSRVRLETTFCQQFSLDNRR